MLRVLLIAESHKAASTLQKKIEHLKDIAIVATLMPQEFFAGSEQSQSIDLILMSPASAAMLVTTNQKIARQHITARTHRQGIQLVAIENIYYFQAEHKYVTAYHTHGQLLIEDSLNSLEQEFAPNFIRIHRKILVARDKVEQLSKDAAGQYFVRLQDVDNLLLVSRRQLPLVRQVLLTT